MAERVHYVRAKGRTLLPLHFDDSWSPVEGVTPVKPQPCQCITCPACAQMIPETDAGVLATHPTAPMLRNVCRTSGTAVGG